MKRLTSILTTLLTAIAMASAQSFEFQFQGRSLDDGATVAIAAEQNVLGELACETNPSTNPMNGIVLKLLDATSAEVSALLSIQSNSLEPTLMQWCMGGDCVIINDNSTQRKTFTASTTEMVLFDASGINAQGTLEATLHVTIGEVTKTVNILFTNNAKQMWVNYYDNNGKWYVYGSSKAERYYVATHVPYGSVGAEDATIDGLSLFFLNSDVTDVQYWVSRTLPAFGGQADLETVQLPESDISFSTFNEVKFTKSHTIPKDGLYVGYSFTISALNQNYSTHPISYRLSSTDYTSGFLLSTSSNTSWRVHNGDLMVQILSGGQFKNNAVSIFADDHVYTLKGSEQTLDVKLQNNGATPVKSVCYVVEADGRQVGSGTAKVYLQNMMSMSTISIPAPTNIEAAIHNCAITITEVNSQINESENNTTETKLYNMLAKSQFMPLFEEFTATWCGWCVRGIVAMNKAHEQYGDKAAIIAVHGSDIMAIDEYSPVIQSFCEGYPTGVANRSETTGISTTTVVDYISNSIDRLTPAAMKANASWANDRHTAIKVETETTFQLDMSGDYAIAYILTADGLKGTGSDWIQSNFYSGDTDSDPDLQYWCQQPTYVSGLTFDHVAVAAWEPLNGVQGSVDSQIKAGIPQIYSFIADVNGNDLIQKNAELKMITLLLDAKTGTYINGAQCTINEYDPSAIDDTQSSASTVSARYRLDGQKIETPQRGINIIRMNDGTVKKVLVR